MTDDITTRPISDHDVAIARRIADEATLAATAARLDADRIGSQAMPIGYPAPTHHDYVIALARYKRIRREADAKRANLIAMVSELHRRRGL